MARSGDSGRRVRTWTITALASGGILATALIGPGTAAQALVPEFGPGWRGWPNGAAEQTSPAGQAGLTGLTGLAGPAAQVGPSERSRGIGQLVVKLAPGASIDRINGLLGSRTVSVLLASRSIYLIAVPLDHPDPDPNRAAKDWPKQAKKLIHELDKDRSVVYAEANSDADSTEGERFHYWPSGGPECVGQSPAIYTGQRAARQLQLARAHQISRGDGTIIAILDTGIMPWHSALQGRIAPGGYDYIDDDATAVDGRDQVDQDHDGRVDEGYGHGTFVAGVAALVAPGAKILPQRVLDTEGRGSVFVVAEAIYDATAAGADVINMSFGTGFDSQSKILDEAVKEATHAGVVVTAAAGNDGTGVKHYPAALTGVLSVAALDQSGSDLANFSAYGDWIDIAAPGVQIASALPCGFGYWSGTSMAAPFVSGEAALLLAVNKDNSEDNSKDNKKDKKKDTETDIIDRNICDGSNPMRGLSVHNGAIDLLRSLTRQRGR
jgi:subtilisin family serine protease